MAKLIPIGSLETLQRARREERDEQLLTDRNHVAKLAYPGLQRQQAWIARNPIVTKHALEDLATALLHAKHAENQSSATAERIRRHA
jgi:hypothetical protein